MIVRSIAFLLVAVAATRADTVTNGDFETGDLTGWSWSPLSTTPGDVVLFDVYGDDGDSFAFQSHDGPGGQLSQSVFLPAGDYFLEWEQAMRNPGVDRIIDSGSIIVTVDGQLVHNWGQGVLNAGETSGHHEIKPFTVATDTTLILSFAFDSHVPSTIELYVDNISVVPEPHAAVLLIASGMAALGRRRARN